MGFARGGPGTRDKLFWDKFVRQMQAAEERRCAAATAISKLEQEVAELRARVDALEQERG